ISTLSKGIRGKRVARAARFEDQSMNLSLLWIPVTLAAAAAQTGRNATQRRLTERIGTVGATQVRFLYGFPFAVAALPLMSLATGETAPGPNGMFLSYALMGAVAQILATALMLSAMRERAFSVVTAYTKTEPVQVALFGLLLLGDRLTPVTALAIGVATSGVVLMSVKPGTDLASSGLRPAGSGIAAGGLFPPSALRLCGGVPS